MRFSLLYKNYVETREFTVNPLQAHMEETIYDLSIDKAVKELSRDADSCNYTLEVMKNPLKTAEEIKYRQEILMDFVAMPKLLEELRDIFKSYDTLQTDWREMRAGIYTYGVPQTSGGILDATYESLKITAAFARKTVSYFRSIYETVGRYEVRSEGLIGIREYCRTMTENESLDEISRISGLFEHETVSSYRFKVRGETDDTLRIIAASLTEALEVEDKGLGTRMKKLAARLTGSGAKEDTTPEVDMGEFHLETARNIVNEALYELYTVLSGITGNIYEFFRGISGELGFYDTGVRYVRRLAQEGAPMCMPEILPMEADCFRTKGIYDLHLLLEGMPIDTITRNDVTIEQVDGTLIRGANSTGKTCTIRSIGAAILFSQAGFPVCADSAEISIRDAIFCQFSSAEKDFDAADAAGRFEGEVKEVAAILGAVTPWSLILFNETFQTTAYAEGAAGMKDILEALPGGGCRYIFVTHMPIFDKMQGDRILKLQFGKDYRITRV
jgi:DNA mismatch repair ATPase MutS